MSQDQIYTRTEDEYKKLEYRVRVAEKKMELVAAYVAHLRMRNVNTELYTILAEITAILQRSLD